MLASSQGGGIFNEGTLSMENCAVHDNTAVSDALPSSSWIGAHVISSCTSAHNLACEGSLHVWLHVLAGVCADEEWVACACWCCGRRAEAHPWCWLRLACIADTCCAVCRVSTCACLVRLACARHLSLQWCGHMRGWRVLAHAAGSACQPAAHATAPSIPVAVKRSVCSSACSLACERHAARVLA